MPTAISTSKKLSKSVHPDLAGVLFSEAQIAKRVKELGVEISKRYAGKDLVVIGVLKGSFMFVSDLVREIKRPMELDFLAASSYAGQNSSGMVRLHYDIRKSIKNRDVILVDDILDTGFSLNFVRKHLMAKGPKSLSICVLLDKPERRKIFVPARYVGFSVPDKFVVGYGLDYNEKYRELPYIGVLKNTGLE